MRTEVFGLKELFERVRRQRGRREGGREKKRKWGRGSKPETGKKFQDLGIFDWMRVGGI